MPIMNTSDLLWTSMGNSTMQKIIFNMLVHNNKAVKSVDWLICNSTYDLEPGAFKLAPGKIINYKVVKIWYLQ